MNSRDCPRRSRSINSRSAPPDSSAAADAVRQAQLPIPSVDHVDWQVIRWALLWFPSRPGRPSSPDGTACECLSAGSVPPAAPGPRRSHGPKSDRAGGGPSTGEWTGSGMRRGPTHRTPGTPRGTGPACWLDSEFSFDDHFVDLTVEAERGVHLLQLAVVFLEFLQSPDVGDRQAAELRYQTDEGRRAGAVLPAGVGLGTAALHLPQDPHDLALAETGPARHRRKRAVSTTFNIQLLSRALCDGDLSIRHIYSSCKQCGNIDI